MSYAKEEKYSAETIGAWGRESVYDVRIKLKSTAFQRSVKTNDKRSADNSFVRQIPTRPFEVVIMINANG